MRLNNRETKLANGIRVLTAEMPGVDSVAIGVWVGVGGRYEPRRVGGVSHFIEHLLFKGTRSRSARDISQAIEGRGGYFNAFTQEESTCYYARVGADHTWHVLEILADMYLHPRFAAEDIEKERGVIIEEIMMYRDQPQHLVQDILGVLLWARHALGLPLVGTPEIIRRISRAEILAFKGSKYVPDNTVVCLAGRVGHDAAVKHVAELLGGVRRRPRPAFRPVSGRTLQGREAVHDKDIEQSHLALGVRLFGRHDPRRYALKLLSIILGENMSSRLFQVVREKHGLAYSIHSSMHLYEETGALVVSAGLDRKRVMKAIGLIVGEMVRFRDARVGPRALRRAKDYAVGQLKIGLESTSSQMVWLGEHTLGYGKVDQPEEVIRKLERVTEDDIRRVASAILRAPRISLAMVTPDAKKYTRDMLQREVARL